MNQSLYKMRRLIGLSMLPLCCVSGTGGAEPAAIPAAAAKPLAADAAVFDQRVHPILQKYCNGCHSTEKQKGDLDLEVFTSLAAVQKHPKIWQNVAEQLAIGEMPPKEKPQPTPAEKKLLMDWVAGALNDLARARAGDPGPVVLRRLSNAQYTYTIRDLTSIATLEPAKEFPIDGAAGEGFTNTGQGLVMSPSLITKYFDAGKDIASHAVLLPDGIRFSAHTTVRDWSEDLLREIRGTYSQYAGNAGGGEKVNLQGIQFETNEGGRLPLEKYLAATLDERDAIAAGKKTVDAIAAERGLSPKYLKTLLAALQSEEPSLLLDGIRARWRAAQPAEATEIAGAVAQWQATLWKFNSVGHIGKVGGPTSWMEAVTPITAKQDVREKLVPGPDGDVSLYLVASDGGDGNEDDFVLWQNPRFVANGKPDILLKDVRAMSQAVAQRRGAVFGQTVAALAAAAETYGKPGKIDVPALAVAHGVHPEVLAAWLNYLGESGETTISSYFTTKTGVKEGGALSGWGLDETPVLLANSSDKLLTAPQTYKAHGIAVHPSPTLQAVIGWRSPIAGPIKLVAKVSDAHTACGNGVSWTVEHRRGSARQRLGAGATEGAKEIVFAPAEPIAVEPGDLLSVLIGPRDGEYTCDMTAVDLTVSSVADAAKTWDLAADVSPDVQAANPHADRQGNPAVWHLYTEPTAGAGSATPVIPAGSLVAQWQAAKTIEEKQKLAEQVQQLLLGEAPDAKGPEAALYAQLVSSTGPLLERTKSVQLPAGAAGAAPSAAAFGIDPALFGKHAKGQSIDAGELCVQAPNVIAIRLPAELVSGYEFVTTATVDPKSPGASAQVQVTTVKPQAAASGLVQTSVAITAAGGLWSDNNQRVGFGNPILVNAGSPAALRFQSAFNAFRDVFPAALCYAKIVPVDEVVTLTLFHREDDQLARLMLSDAEKAKLDRLWEELHFVSADAITKVDVLAQLIEYATQDADPKVFTPLVEPYAKKASEYRQWLLATEPKHVEAVLKFAERAYRRPVTAAENADLSKLYQQLRKEEVPHAEAIRLMLARIFVSPAFLYRAENPGPAMAQVPVDDWELANRLSYFLWSSMPDAELGRLAAAGKLRDAEVLAQQTQRLLMDPRINRLSAEFACQWLHINDLQSLDEKSERHFPTFLPLRGAMYEESLAFFTDFFQNDRSVLELLDADYTFLNESLAKHYEIPGVTGEQWRRVDGIKKFSRGGILDMASTLAKQSGASRTSPILRGNWVAEVLLGDKLPKPPKDVPQLPEDESTEKLSVRELTEKHTSDPRCAGCHQRIDAFGFTLESFDAIGRARTKDLADRPIDTKAKVMDGTEITGIEGLRAYLLTARRDVFVKQFTRKLLGYALGRGVQLSDEPLLDEIQTQLKANDYHIGVAISSIVKSRQFLEIRGRDLVVEE